MLHPLELATHTKSGNKLGIVSIDSPFAGMHAGGLHLPPMNRGGVMQHFNNLLTPDNSNGKLTSSPRVGLSNLIDE